MGQPFLVRVSVSVLRLLPAYVRPRLRCAALLVLLPELPSLLSDRDDAPGVLGDGAELVAAQRAAERSDARRSRRSAASWQVTHVVASGIASSRPAAIGSPQTSQMP